MKVKIIATDFRSDTEVREKTSNETNLADILLGNNIKICHKTV
jgi:hypothetical protein